MSFQILKVHKLERGNVRRRKLDARWAPRLQCFFPSEDTKTPAVSCFEPGKLPFRMGRDKIVAPGNRKLKKFLGHFRTDQMHPSILRTGFAVAITVKSGHWFLATTLQRLSENI